MLYELTHFIQAKIPWIWNIVEFANSELFAIQHRITLKELPALLGDYQNELAMTMAAETDAVALAEFFAEQPEDAFVFFKPHAFDEKTLRKLAKRKASLGKMVDINAQGQGIGKKMCLCAMVVASKLDLRMYETISKENIASLYSTQHVLDVKIVKEMGNGYLYKEDIKKKADRWGYVIDIHVFIIVAPQEGLLYAA